MQILSAAKNFTVGLSRAKSRGEQQYIINKALAQTGLSLPWGSGKRNLFVLDYPDRITWAMVYPFFHHAGNIASCRVTFAPEKGPRDADRVFLFCFYDANVETLLQTLREMHPRAEIIYVDWYAPLDFRMINRVIERVDLYVKKHWSRSAADAVGPFRGDTNLMDFFGKRYGIEHTPQRWELSSSLETKARMFPGFFSEASMYQYLQSAEPLPPRQAGRTTVLHSILTSKGTPWYEAMRDEATAAVNKLTCSKFTKKVSHREFVTQMCESQMCFSPFGYGEVSWRDYEAVLYGAVLVKQHMGHIVSDPDIYIAGETYIPVKWDLSDLGDVIERYAADPKERQRIADNAREVLISYLRGQRFEEDWIHGSGVSASQLGAYVG